MTASTRRGLLLSGAGLGLTAMPAMAASQTGPAAHGATPAPRQLAWHKRQAYAFVHFTINTFTDREWGYGDESVSLFNPTDFSADQIVEAAKSGGLKAIILTAKHHDGFCLWPSRYTEHSVKYSPYKDGKGDIVREMSEACRRHGLEFGLYLSPWDRNHAEYGRPAYVEYYHNQLQELTTQYGPLVEVWFDGANGGDGYYGGARERRKIDGHTYYQWDKVREIVRKNQPNAVMFADSDMDVRWVGNEEGIAGDPCWPTWDYTTPYSLEKANAGVRGGPIWNPAEVDVSIRPGWFWHADEAPRTPANLLNLWFVSVGRGGNLLLNIAPDRRGRIPDEDVASLKAWKAIRDQGSATNLAAGATVTASSERGRAYAPKNALSQTTAWAARSGDRAGAWLQLDLPKPVTFDVIRLAEDITKGVRVDDYAVDIKDASQWREIARHTAIGYERLIRLDQPVSAKAVRLRIISAAAAPVIRNIGLFRLPDILEEPAIRRDAQGLVTLKSPAEGLEVRYTLDGSQPSAASLLYSTPFALPDTGTVKAVTRRAATGIMSTVVTREFDVSPARWRVVSSNGENATDLLAGGKFIGPVGEPVEIVLDLAQVYTLTGFTVKPVGQNLTVDEITRMGPPAGYELWLSNDGQNWNTPVATGEFSNIAASRAEQKIRFDAPHAGRFLRLRLPRAVQDKSIIMIGGLGILTR
ncbi:MAG: alpha-L-fucosidase [Asticcacaulis sp.]|uniref:alpha-L-fucosidase n=1 Tax=Asticcacaulis sp. TaxID=1872648 RepID=UPI0039E3825F